LQPANEGEKERKISGKRTLKIKKNKVCELKKVFLPLQSQNEREKQKAERREVEIGKRGKREALGLKS